MAGIRVVVRADDADAASHNTLKLVASLHRATSSHLVPLLIAPIYCPARRAAGGASNILGPAASHERSVHHAGAVTVAVAFNGRARCADERTRCTHKWARRTLEWARRTLKWARRINQWTRPIDERTSAHERPPFDEWGDVGECACTGQRAHIIADEWEHYHERANTNAATSRNRDRLSQARYLLPRRP